MRAKLFCRADLDLGGAGVKGLQLRPGLHSATCYTLPPTAACDDPSSCTQGPSDPWQLGCGDTKTKMILVHSGDDQTSFQQAPTITEAETLT